MYEIKIINVDTGEVETWTVTDVHALQAIHLHCELSLGEPKHSKYVSRTTVLPEGPSYTKEY